MPEADIRQASVRRGFRVAHEATSSKYSTVSIFRRRQAKVTAATVSWCDDLPADERKARVRELRALAHMLAPQSSLVAALPAAETGDQVALAVASAELARLPALPRRRILATDAALRCPEPGKS